MGLRFIAAPPPGLKQNRLRRTAQGNGIRKTQAYYTLVGEVYDFVGEPELTRPPDELDQGPSTCL